LDLEALEAQWQAHPPVHLLVASFLGHEPPAVQTPAAAGDDGDGKPAEWLAGMGGIPASQAVREATTSDEAMRAFERQMFGEVKDVHEL
jgi:hypothetical protein